MEKLTRGATSSCSPSLVCEDASNPRRGSDPTHGKKSDGPYMRVKRFAGEGVPEVEEGSRCH